MLHASQLHVATVPSPSLQGLESRKLDFPPPLLAGFLWFWPHCGVNGRWEREEAISPVPGDAFDRWQRRQSDTRLLTLRSSSFPWAADRGTTPVDSGNLTSSISSLQPFRHLHNQFPALNSVGEIRDWILTGKMSWCDPHFWGWITQPTIPFMGNSLQWPVAKSPRQVSTMWLPQPHCRLRPLLPLPFQAERSDLSSGELEPVTLKYWVGLCYCSNLKQVLARAQCSGPHGGSTLSSVDAFFGCCNLGVLLPSRGRRPGMC